MLPPRLRALEYQVDETHYTVTKGLVLHPHPARLTTFMGDNQRLPDGNIFLDWGSPSTAAGYSFISMSEVDPAGNILFELSFDQPYVSYRAFLSPWQGTPDTLPTLAFKADTAASPWVIPGTAPPRWPHTRCLAGTIRSSWARSTSKPAPALKPNPTLPTWPRTTATSR